MTGHSLAWAVDAAALTASALLLALIGLFALLRRGPWLVTLLFSSAFLSLGAFESGTLGMVNAGTALSAREWATYLVRNSALVSWLWLTLSVVLGRAEPRRQIRAAGAYLVLALLGCAIVVATASTRFVVAAVEGAGPGTLVVFGPLGKLYLMYLVVAMVAVLMNLESMLRTAPAAAQRRLRPLFVAILVAILVQLLVVSGGLLVGALRLEWMVGSAPVLFGAGTAASLALARRRLSDLSVPAARPVIYYSSVSLTLAGAFLLTMAVLSRLIPVLSAEWKLAVTLGFLVFVGGGGLVLMLSPATSRAIKRLVDRNLYANRYDYRREWERVSAALTPAAPFDDVARQVVQLVSDVFEAEEATIHLREPDEDVFVRVIGSERAEARIPADGPLMRHLAEHRVPLVIQDFEHDLDHIPLLVARRATLQATGAAVCAPLAVGDQLVGVLWVSGKRGGEAWSTEDVEFLAAMSRQLASALWFARQGERAAEARQLESLHRLSSFVLHDIKNQVSGLSLVVDNARRHLGNPEFQKDAMAVVERTVRSLRELMEQVSGVGRTLQPQPTPCTVRVLVADALTASGMAAAAGSAPPVDVRVTGEEEAVVDGPLMQRVVVNLLTNAREASRPGGRITLDAGVRRDGGDGPVLELRVTDEGRGMTEDFVRTRLFRPFATTKANGLGIGLAQCRAIVEAHGGRVDVHSRPGEGTTFVVRVPADGSGAVPGAEGDGERA